MFDIWSWHIAPLLPVRDPDIVTGDDITSVITTKFYCVFLSFCYPDNVQLLNVYFVCCSGLQ